MQKAMKITTTLFPLFLLISLLLCTTFMAVRAENLTTISSTGMVRSQTSELIVGYGMSGGFVSDTSWGPLGRYFAEYHIQMLAGVGCNILRIGTNYMGWQTNYQVGANVPDKDYPDYIAQLCQWCRQYGIKVFITMHRYETSGTFDYTDKADIIRNNGGAGDAWIAWGVEMIEMCQPDAIDTMNEHTSVVTHQEWYDFNVRSIEAYRAVSPNITIFVEGTRGSGNARGRLDDFMDNPLPYDNIVYYLHRYWERMQDSYCYEYRDGDPVLAKQMLYTFLDGEFHINNPDTLWPNVWIGEMGAYQYQDNKPNNWELAIQGYYDWCEDRDVGHTQYAFGKSNHPMFDTATHTQFNDAGQLWIDNLP